MHDVLRLFVYMCAMLPVLFLCLFFSHEVFGLKCWVQKELEHYPFKTSSEENAPLMLMDCHDPKIDEISGDDPVPRTEKPSCYAIFGKGKGVSYNKTKKGCTASNECDVLANFYKRIWNWDFVVDCRECGTDGCNKFFNDAHKPNDFGLNDAHKPHDFGLVSIIFGIFMCLYWK